MADSTPPHSLFFPRNLIQLKKKLITAHGNSISIHKGANAKMIREKQIFSKSNIQFLVSIGEENEGKAFFLALSSKRIVLFQLKKESPIAIFKLDEKIVDHGTVQVLNMERKKEGEFRVKLIIPIAFHSGTVRKVRLIVHFRDSQITKQKMKCLEEMRIEDEKMRFCAYLGNGNFFGFYDDTVVKSDGLVTRAEEPSTKKKRRIAVVARELWNGNILFATENGTIRVIRTNDGNRNESNSMKITSEGQCIPPYCTLRCREPSVIISMENTVIIGTKRGEIHFLNERLELRCKIDTEGGPINCLKLDENDTEFLWVGFESGELRMLFMPDSDQNDVIRENSVEINQNEAIEECEEGLTSQEVKKFRRNTGKPRGLVCAGRCKRSELPIVCPFCDEFKTLVTQTFVMHLRVTHKTSLALAGLLFRCQCGHESVTSNHSIKITPQCTICQAYPRTVYGYADHLYKQHRATLEEIEYYLKCGVCGVDFYNIDSCRKHPKLCKSRFYSLLKLGEEEKNKDETEMDQTADG